MRPPVRLLAVAVAVAAAASAVGVAPPARAATVSAVTDVVRSGDRNTLDFVSVLVTVAAAPGERNVLTLDVARIRTSGEPEGSVVVTDTGASLQAGAGCDPTPDGVACPLPPAGARAYPVTTRAVIHAGDGDDRVTTGLIEAAVFGDAGNDTLTSGATSSLTGGDGDDTLAGGPGADQLDGGPGADAISGGDGTDTVTYGSRRAGVTVALGGSADDGEPGEGDRIAADVEDALGGSGDDVLIGTDGANRLDGQEGADRIEGLGGNDDLRDNGSDVTRSGRTDVVLGGDGSDHLLIVSGLADGGAGDDVIVVAGTARIVGGPGSDTIESRATLPDTTIDGRDTAADLVRCTGGPAAKVLLDDRDVSLGCGAAAVRRTWPGTFRLVPPLSDMEYHSGNLDVACADDRRGGCSLSVSLRIGRRVVARTRLHLPAGAERPLDPAALSLRVPDDAVPNVRHADPRPATYLIAIRTPAGTLRTVQHSACLYSATSAPPSRCYAGSPVSAPASVAATTES